MIDVGTRRWCVYAYQTDAIIIPNSIEVETRDDSHLRNVNWPDLSARLSDIRLIRGETVR